jgi:hypothetical protein
MKAAINAVGKSGKEIISGGAYSNISSESNSTGTYHVFKLFNVNKFVGELNSRENRENLESLMRYEEPRIITSIAIVFDQKLNSKLDVAENAELEIKNSGLGNTEFNIKAEGSQSVIASLSDGTVFAFEYSRICWEMKYGEVKVFSLEADRPGRDNICPSGTADSVGEL